MAEPAPAPVAAEVVHDPAASVAESSTLAALETTGAADGVGPASVPSPAPSAAASEAPSAAPSASDAARARREARKAKILARGTDRLARITSAGRGSEGASLYAPSPGPSLASAHTADATSSSVVPSAEGEDAQGAPTAFSSDPPEATLGQVVPPRVGPEPNEDDPLQQFMRALQAQMGPDMGPGMGSEAGARSDAGTGAGSGSGSPFPPFPGAGAGAGAGAGPNTGPGAGGQEDPFAAMMAQMQAMSGGPGTAAAATAPAPRTWVDYLLTWVHFLAIVAFALFTFGAAFTAHWHPASAPLTAQTFEHPPRSILNAWGRLARAPPDAADLGAFNLGAHMPLQQFPLFSLFVTLEIVLQSGRMWRLRGKRVPAGLVRTIASQIPIPAVQILVRTCAQYWSLVSSLLDDIAVLVFVLGTAILTASWRSVHEPQPGR